MLNDKIHQRFKVWHTSGNPANRYAILIKEG